MKRILIIEDNLNYRMMLKTYLEKEGYHIEEASDGLAGLQIYIPDRFDLIIMDIYLPKIDGVSAIHRIKEKFSDAKIIAMSGTRETELMTDVALVKASKNGADYLYRKTDDIHELLANIKSLLNEK